VQQPDRTPIDDFLEEAQRQLSICNGCRYCEGYCAVFPALERQPVLGEGDLTYLANLCHDCRACFQACMYAPPHEFAVEIPRLLSDARERSYEQFARPRWLARKFTAGPRAIAELTLAGTVVFALFAWLAGNVSNVFGSSGTFYDVVPYALLLVPMLLLSALILGVIAWGYVDFHRASHGAARLGGRAWLTGLREIALLRWMRGGGDDCYYPDAESPSASRRYAHHLVAYGFVLSFVSTTLAAFYAEILDRPAPYPVLHPVVIAGLVGGIALVLGATVLLWQKRRSSPLGSPRERALNKAFLISLDLAAATGLVLLLLRDTGAMGALLVIHLGTIVALYLTAPYGKFVHIVYRSAAVLRSAAERAADDAAAAARAAPEASASANGAGAPGR
jgi:citrate/tricarballylate utilization protein